MNLSPNKIAIFADSDTIMGFSLTGLSSEYFIDGENMNEEEIEETAESIFRKKDIAIFLVGEFLIEKSESLQKQIENYNKKFPVIVKLPSKNL